MDMFERLLDIIQVSCQEQYVSESDYYSIVECIRHYSPEERPLSEIEKNSISKRTNWNPLYNPLIDPSKIRYSFVFGTNSNVNVQAAISAYKAL
jgi:hypothetical protein